MNNSIRFDSYAAILRSNLDKTQDGLSKALMRMSSGLKVLSAKDDASGVVLSSKLNVDLHGLDIANNNIQQGLAMLNTAEGGINEAQNILIRLRDLSLKVLNGTCDEDQKRAIEEEAEQLSQEIQRIRLNTKYNGISLFNNTSDNKNASGDNNLINSGGNGDRNTGDILPMSNRALSSSLVNINPPPNHLLSDFDTGDTGDPGGTVNIENNEDTISKTPKLDNNISISQLKSSSSGGIRLLGAGATTDYSYSFAAGETKSITFDTALGSRTYSITNRNESTVNFTAKIDNSTGEITFGGDYFTINSTDDNAQKTVLNGAYTYFYGTSKNDAITINNGSCRVYAGDGDDTIKNLQKRNVIYAGNGNDKLFQNGGGQNVVYMEDGNDEVIYVRNNEYDYVNLGDGNDTLRGGTLDGGVNNARNCKKSFVYGTGTNTYQLTGSKEGSVFDISNNKFSNVNIGAGETKSITIATNSGNRTYIVSNDIDHESSLQYKYDSENDKITFAGANITVTGESNKSHNVELLGRWVFFHGGNKDDNILVRGRGNEAYGGGGNDTLTADIYSEYAVLQGDDGNDLITMNGGSGTIRGSNGNDTLYANVNCSVYGDGGDDTIYLSSVQTGNVSDTSGNNTFYIENSGVRVTAGSGSDTFYVNGNNDTINAGSGNDTFYVNGSNDTINAGGGADTFEISGSNNTINGESGNDYFAIYGSGNTINGGAGTNYYLDYGTDNTVTSAIIDTNVGSHDFTYVGEQYSFTFGNKTYTVTNSTETASDIANNSFSYRYNTVSGELILTGSNLTVKCSDYERHIVTIEGSNNTLDGSNYRDVITVKSGTNNLIRGNDGNDTITMNTANNAIYSGAGVDTVILNASTNKTVDLGDDNDVIYINSDNNTNINMGSGNDTVQSATGASNNNINLSGGNDNISLHGNNNNITAEAGSNTIFVSGTDNTVAAGGGNNTLNIEGNQNIISARGNSTIDINGDKNELTLSGDSNNVTSGGYKNSVSSTGNSTFTMNGNKTTISSNGNSSIRVEGDNAVITSIGDSSITSSGLNGKITSKGNSTVNQTGNNATIKADTGNVTINGNNSTLTAKGANLYIQGDNNEVENTAVETRNIEITVNGSQNNISSLNTQDRLRLNGDNNTVSLNNHDDKIDIKGNNNTVTTTNGKNSFELKGDLNNVKGGADNDTFSVVSGDRNTVNGGSTAHKNKVIDYGTNTIITNCLDITPQPLNIEFQVGPNADDVFNISMTFKLGSFYVDFTDTESIKDSLERIDDALNDINSEKAKIGAVSARLEQMLELNTTRKITASLAKSVITDCDMAEESHNFVLNNIKRDMVSSLFSQAYNLKRESVLGLINRI